jgi:hypothetical protein
MEDDNLDGAPQDAAPEPSLRDTLMAAFQEADTAPAPELDAPEPDGETEAQRAERLRDERGRFAKAEEAAQKPGEAGKAAAAPEGAKVPETASSAQPEAAQAAPEAAKPAGPPPGWSPQSKAAFASLPPHVQADIVKREGEVNQGLAKLRDYKDLEPFANLAKQSGTTLVAAFQSYKAAEDLLAKDFAGGVTQLGAHYGYQHPVQIAAAVLRVHPQQLVAALQGGQAAAPQGQPAQPAPQPHPEIQRLEQQLNAVSSAVAARQRAEQEAALRQSSSIVERFFADPTNLYAHDVQSEILELVERDQNRFSDPQGALQRAYQEAVWRNPTVRAQLIKEQAQREAEAKREAAQKQAQVAARARQASRSITGSPSAGTGSADVPADNLRDELMRQFSAQRGRV